MKKITPQEIFSPRKVYPDGVPEKELDHIYRVFENLCEAINSRFVELVETLAAQVGTLNTAFDTAIQESVMQHMQVVKAELINLKNKPKLQVAPEAKYTVEEILGLLKTLAGNQ